MLVHVATAAIVLCYALVAFNYVTSPALVLAFMFLLGLGAACSTVMWQIGGPDLVPESAGAAATTFISAGFNLARMIGPLVAAPAVQVMGFTKTLCLSTVLLGVAVVLLSAHRWSPPSGAEFNARAIDPRSSIQHSLAGFWDKRIVQTFVIASSGSALSALLPSIVQQRVGAEIAGQFGLLSSSLGFGALIGAAASKFLHQRLNAARGVKLSSAIFALLMAFFTIAETLWLGCLLCLALGASWFLMITSSNIAIRADSPVELRGLAIARFILTFALAMTIGSALWGMVGSYAGARAALFLAACGVAASLGIDINPSSTGASAARFIRMRLLNGRPRGRTSPPSDRR
jgi:predicted MFS family arabinose efflux permease